MFEEWEGFLEHVSLLEGQGVLLLALQRSAAENQGVPVLALQCSTAGKQMETLPFMATSRRLELCAGGVEQLCRTVLNLFSITEIMSLKGI